MSPEERDSIDVSRTGFELQVGEDRLIRGDIRERTVPAGDPRRAIVVCHGFKGFKDWGFFPYLSDRLAGDTGSTVVSFNFSGCGIGPDRESFTDLEGFSRNTFSREVEDLGVVLDGLRAGRLGPVTVTPPGHVGLFGHSRGAAAVILLGERRPEVCAIATWGGIASVFRYEAWFADELGDGALMHVLNARTGQELPIRRDVLDDLRANRSELDMEAAASRLSVPLLVVHGSEDEAVPIGEARHLSAAAPGSRLEIIEGASHTMGASHPFPGTNPHLERAVEATAAHFDRACGEER